MDEQRAWIKLRRKKRLRLLAAALSLCLLFTAYPNISEMLSVFATGSQGGEAGLHISCFAKLPEEIREQTVPVGTELSELELPDSLEAYVVADKGENSSGGGIEEDVDKEIPGDPEQNNNQNKDDEGDGSSTGEEGENGDSSSTGEEGENGDSSSTGEEGGNGDGGENITENGTEQSGTEESDGGEENTDIEDDQEQNTQPEESGMQEADTEETHAVAMQEYYAENVVTVENLENTQASEEKEETITVEGVTWQPEPLYDGDITGTYMFTAVLPEDYTVAEGVSLPQITVTVQENGEAVSIWTLLARIATLPDVEEYLAKEPDIEQEEAYEEWLRYLHEYIEEALAVWEEYMAMGEEQRIQIPEEIVAKLTAWVQIAEAFKQSDMVMTANAEHTHSGSNITFRLWDKTDSLPTDSGNWYLNADVTLTAYYQIPGNVSICLNGHTISNDGRISDGMIRVYNDMLNIYDCSSSASGKIYCSGINNPILVSRHGVLNLYGGTVEAAERTAIPIGTGSTDSSGGTVNVYSGAAIRGGFHGILVNAGLSSSYVNIYGGSVTGGGSGYPVNMTNQNGSVTIYGDAEINPVIYTVAPVVANTQVSNIYTIDYENVKEGDIVVRNSADMKHFKLPDSSSYVLVPYEGNLIAGRSEYAVTLNLNGGSDGTDLVKYATGKGVELPKDWKKTGYIFEGWYEKADLSGTKIERISDADFGDKTYYAKWLLESYTITYHLDGGAVSGNPNPTAYTVESDAIKLTNPARVGYTFKGWSGTGLTGNTNKNVTVAKGSVGNREYTANWTANTYRVTLNGNGGSAGTTLTDYTYGTGATLPTNWTKPGYTFAGWYENSNLSGSAVTAIPGTDTGNKNFYAKWTANQYTVTFDYQEATGGNGTKTKKVTYDGVYGELPTPSRTGYAFKGWYTQADGKGNQITSESIVGTAGAHTLYAYWLDETAPDVPVLQDGTTLPTGWNNGQDTIPLKLYDGVAVTGLLVSVDGGAYTQVTQFPSGSTEYAYKVTEGEHTYRFKAVDAAGNESAQSAEYKIMLDTTKPVIETLSYENKAKNFLDWIIGKKSLIIHVPVKEDGSGVTEINYTMTPIDESGDLDDDSTVAKTAPVKNGEAKITFAGEFRGRVVITCADKAGNAADSVTVDTKAGANGVIVEDRAPEISMLADRNISDMTGTQPGGVELSENYYESVPAVIVTVKDDTDNAISAGIDQITYQVDSAEKTVSARQDMLQSEITFTIPADEIPTGVTVIRVNATDNAGNEASKSVTVRIKGPEKTPAAAINYQTEKLKDLVPKAEYLINGTSCTADGAGCIAINKGWLGTTVSIVKKGNGNETSDSGIQNLIIPQRPQKPSPVGADVSTPGGKGKLTGLTAYTSYEVSADGGRTWESSSTNGSGELTGLAPGSYIVHVKAGTSNFASENSDPAKIGAYQITIIFMANGEKYKEISMDYGTALMAIPSVPKKEDGGNQTYVGEWCDAQGNPVDFTSITANMTVYAAYTAGYTVTLQGGTGCTLSAISGSKSPVKEGSSFTFKFTLGQGYEKTSGFAVKVNGEAVKLTAGETYTITDIRENKTVTVEGVRRKPSSGGSTSSGSTGSSGGSGNHGGSDKETGGGSSTDNSVSSGADPSANSNQQAGGSSTTGDTSAGSTPPSGTDSETPVGGNPFGGTDSRTPVGGNPFGGTDDKTPPDGKPADRTEGVADETPPDGNPSGEKDTIVTVPVSIENGRIIISGGAPEAALGKTMEEQSEGASEILYGEHIATGNVDGMTAISTILQMSDGNANSTGAVIVTVVCEEQACTAGVADAVAVANAVLTAEQIQLVNDGETTEIRIDVTDISENVPTQDKKVIEEGVEAYRKELPELTLGMYIDISMFIKIGAGDWSAITTTGEPIEVVIGIPEELQSEGREYYIIRAHGGEYTFMEDQDDVPDTITISTDMFSSYAIAYRQTDGAGVGNAEKCGLCHICPTFLGICYFIWMAIAMAGIIIVIVLLRRRTQEEK